jgi:chemotaxis regulatin CheY-phosphate phosphatase CheZ
VIPLFQVISEVTPAMDELEQNARKNVKEWENFVET